MHCNHCTSCTILVTGKHGTSSGKKLYFILAHSHWSDPSHLLTIEAYLLPSACSKWRSIGMTLGFTEMN